MKIQNASAMASSIVTYVLYTYLNILLHERGEGYDVGQNKRERYIQKFNNNINTIGLCLAHLNEQSQGKNVEQITSRTLK